MKYSWCNTLKNPTLMIDNFYIKLLNVVDVGDDFSYYRN